MNLTDALKELWALRPSKQKQSAFTVTTRQRSRAWTGRKISLKNGQYTLSPTTSRPGTPPGRRHYRRLAVRKEGWKMVKYASNSIKEAA